MSTADSNEVTARDPNASTRDLYNAINRGNYPSWTMYVQIMTEQQTYHLNFDPFSVAYVSNPQNSINFVHNFWLFFSTLRWKFSIMKNCRNG